MKRDDLIHPFISGNKWRKLSHHIEHPNLISKKGLMTCGGPWSNHLLATASLGQSYSIKTIGLVRGTYHKFVNPILEQCSRFGMELHYLTNTVFNELKSKPNKVISELELTDYQFIPMGGDDISGQVGSQAIVHEVLVQDQRPDLWLMAAGTGATASGILTAIDYPCTVKVFPAINSIVEINKLKLRLSSINTRANLEYFEPHRCRFGAIDHELIDFVRSFQETTGILLDPFVQR